MVPHGDFQTPESFIPFCIGYGLMGLGFIISWQVQSIAGSTFWAIALLCRALLLFMYPGDDIWRYLWEGLIQTHGLSPYHLAPNAPELIPYRTDWWPLINHPDVSAIYPPLTQLGFRLLAAIAPSVLLFKLAIVAADGLICQRLTTRVGYRKALVYAWNPLILYSFAGAGHYDSWFLLPLVLAWLSFDSTSEPPRRQHTIWSALWTGLSIAVKWMSLPLLGFLVWRAYRQWNMRMAIAILAIGLLPIALTVLPYCSGGSCPLIPTDSVFVSHGRSAELIPHAIAQIWSASRWENWLFALPLALFTLWLLLRATSFLEMAEGYLVALLLLSPIVHAWYFTWLTPFSAASRNWGTRWVSLSAVVYFMLPHRQGLGALHWSLRRFERLWLWGPFILGQGYSLWKPQTPNSYPRHSLDSAEFQFDRHE